MPRRTTQFHFKGKQEAEKKQEVKQKELATKALTHSTMLDKFPDKNGPFAHKITGEEANHLVSQVQSYMIENDMWRDSISKEFSQVYEAVGTLDKNYQQGLELSILSAKKASQDAKSAQKDIDDTLEILQKTIDKLNDLKDEVNSSTPSDIMTYQERISICEMENAVLKLRMKIAFIIAVGAIGLSVIQLILLLTGVL